MVLCYPLVIEKIKQMSLLSFLQQVWGDLQRITNFNFFILSFIFLFTLLLLFKFSPRASGGKGKLNLPPSPPKLPLIGNLHQLGQLPHRSLRALSEKYGPLMLLQLGKAPTLVVSSPQFAREIMKTHDTVFANRVRIQAAEIFYNGCTSISFSPYGEYWRQIRKIGVLELLSLKRVQSFQLGREEVVAELIQSIRSSCASGASVNLSELLHHTSSCIVSKAIIGGKFEDGKESFGALAKKETQLLGAFCFQDFFPSLGWLDGVTGLTAKFKETSKELNSFLDRVFDEQLNTKSSGNDQSDDSNFVAILLQLEKDGRSGNLTRDNLRSILVDIFIAATDTTSTTMGWAMAELMKKPTTMKKAQEQVRQVLGKKSKLEEVDINKIDYLKCIIKETLRLHPPVPLLVPRESSEKVTLEGYDIPPKTRVFINVWAIQRDPKVWDRPEEFLPERFEKNSIEFMDQDFLLIPFGGGRRGCPGMTFGIIEMEHVLASLLYWFDWELPDGATAENLDMSELSGIVIHKKTNLQVVPLLHSF